MGNMGTDSLADLVRHVHHQGRRVAFSDEDGNPAAVLIDADELDRIERRNETLEVLADPELRDQLRESAEDMEAGRTYSFEQVLSELAARKQEETPDS